MPVRIDAVVNDSHPNLWGGTCAGAAQLLQLLLGHNTKDHPVLTLVFPVRTYTNAPQDQAFSRSFACREFVQAKDGGRSCPDRGL